MDVRFLTGLCDAYLFENDIDKKYDKKQIEVIRKTILNNILELTRELRDSDIELYDALYDRSKVLQQQIIKEYLNLTYGDEETINESIMAISAGIGLLATMLYTGPSLTKGIMFAAHKIAQGMESIGKTITTLGREAKFRYAIIEKNAQQCYQKCGIRPDEVSSTSFFAVTKNPAFFASPDGVKQGSCLRECYIEYAIKSMGLLSQAYFACLKKTGNFTDIENANADDLVKVISGLKLASVCNEYYIELKNGFDNFYALLDFVYIDDESKKTDANLRLKSELLQKRNAFARFTQKQR